MNSSQEIAAAIGFSSFWGFSPACELNKFCPPQKSLNILLVGTSDIRHVMATLSSLIIGEQPGGPDDVHFFISEREKETLARAILLLQVVSEVNIPYQERVDLFLDLWANTFIREKSSKYLDALLPELDRLVSDPGKCQIPVRHVMDLSILKHKERDDLCDVFKSWHSKVPFNMEELRDQRLRFHFKERYDFRKNIVDYDYHNGIREEGPIISYSLYRDWRLNGVAFEQRFSSYIVANRTLSSYTDGRRKDSKTSCLVRGFWGDIVVSPFVGCGLVTTSKPEDEFFYRKQNLQHRFNAQQLTEFNLHKWIRALQKSEDYHLGVEITGPPPPPKPEPQEEVKAEEPEEPKPEEPSPSKIEEEQENRRKEAESDLVFERAGDLLSGFKKLNVKVHLLTENLEGLSKRKRFEGLFDLVALGLLQQQEVKGPGLKKILKPKGVVVQETPYFIVPLDRKLRADANEKFKRDAFESGFDFDSELSNKHFVIFRSKEE